MNDRTIRHKMVDIEADINDVARAEMDDAHTKYVASVNTAKAERKDVLQQIRKDRKEAIRIATQELYESETETEAETDENTEIETVTED